MPRHREREGRTVNTGETWLFKNSFGWKILTIHCMAVALKLEEETLMYPLLYAKHMVLRLDGYHPIS